jgi:hypothetical protein
MFNLYNNNSVIRVIKVLTKGIMFTSWDDGKEEIADCFFHSPLSSQDIGPEVHL